jgi:phosphoenolpyruvate-protein kinase (PTS system EI component)
MNRYRGTTVSEGTATGELYLPGVPSKDMPSKDMPSETGQAAGVQADGALAPAAQGAADGSAAFTVTAADVRAAFAAVATDRSALADQLRSAGRGYEADIVQIGALMAADPALSGPALDALAAARDAPAGTRAAPGNRAAGQAEEAIAPNSPARYPLSAAVAAVTEAAEAQAMILESLPDPDLAQRAGDVRQVAAAVVARLAGGGVLPPPQSPFILVRAEVDPADLIRLADTGNLVGAVSVGGGASSHAAIIARGLGLPMLAGVDPAALTAPAGHLAVLDADDGELRVDPASADTGPVNTGFADPAHAGLDRVPGPGTVAGTVAGAARTTDGATVAILCNVASAAETRLGLENGAAGVGLLRTEIPFTRASGWPTRAEHRAALTPVLSLLQGKRAVVRLLDFAGDKVPPFPGAEGLTAFLHAPGALAAQLTAILEAGAGTDLAIMIPMVQAWDEVDLVRAALAGAAEAAGIVPPPLGMMVELAATAQDAPAFAGAVDFFSIGTNDLTADVLHRERAALRPADAADPQVLAAVAATVRAAADAGIGLSVCGDAAADPAVLPALLALGVRTVSVGAAKVPAVARWIAQADTTKPVIPDAGLPAR